MSALWSFKLIKLLNNVSAIEIKIIFKKMTERWILKELLRDGDFQLIEDLLKEICESD